jgi:hypothetical protein
MNLSGGWKLEKIFVINKNYYILAVLVVTTTSCAVSESPAPAIKSSDTFFGFADQSVISDYAIGDTLHQTKNLTLKFTRVDYDTISKNDWIPLTPFTRDLVFRSSAIGRLMLISGKGDYAGGKEWNLRTTPELLPKLYFPVQQLQDYLSQRIPLNSNQYMFIDGPVIISIRDKNRVGIIWIHSIQRDRVILSLRISL